MKIEIDTNKILKFKKLFFVVPAAGGFWFTKYVWDNADSVGRIWLSVLFGIICFGFAIGLYNTVNTDGSPGSHYP